MATFADLEFKPRGDLDGTQARQPFPNGYLASVIRGHETCGGDQGLYELSVCKAGGVTVYDTPITDDVLGYLTEGDVTQALAKIEALPVRGTS